MSLLKPQNQPLSEADIEDNLGELREEIDESEYKSAKKSNKILEFFNNLFESDSGKSKFAVLMGAIIGFLKTFKMPGQENENSEEESGIDAERVKLREEIDDQIISSGVVIQTDSQNRGGKKPEAEIKKLESQDQANTKPIPIPVIDNRQEELPVKKHIIDTSTPEVKAVMNNPSLSAEDKAKRIEKIIADNGIEVDFSDIRNDPKLSPAEKIIKIAQVMIEKRIFSRHCGDYIKKAYYMAGYKGKTIFTSIGDYEGRDCGENCAKESDLDKIEQGDWLWLNNRNKSSARGTHSVIFLGWTDKNKYQAQVMGYYAAGKTSRSVFHTYKITLRRPPGEERPKLCQPVTRIYKPIAMA